MAAEDRNHPPRPHRALDGSVAAVHHGGRGSQRRHAAARAAVRRGWRPSTMAAEDRNAVVPVAVPDVATGGGRPPWRPRIATRCARPPASRPMAVAAVHHGARGSQHLQAHVDVAGHRQWRPSTMAAEDRNYLRGLYCAAEVEGGGRPPWRPRTATRTPRLSHRPCRVWGR